jgi:hypothetical protein
MQPLFELRSRSAYHVGIEDCVHPEMDAADTGAVESTYCRQEGCVKSMARDAGDSARGVQHFRAFFGNALARPQNRCGTDIRNPWGREYPLGWLTLTVNSLPGAVWVGHVIKRQHVGDI